MTEDAHLKHFVIDTNVLLDVIGADASFGERSRANYALVSRDHGHLRYFKLELVDPADLPLNGP